jgi:uncharacterized protein (DUF4213/DUF364 family)
MTITQDFLEIIQKVDDVIKIPSIQEAFFPPLEGIASNFGAIKLEDGSIGVIYVSLSPEIKEIAAKLNTHELIGMDPIELAKNFKSNDKFKKTLGLGAINAISQHVYSQAGLSLDFTTDSLGLLDLQSGDKVGMVGFFPPLVKKIEQLGNKLIIIEKKEQLIKKSNKWEVTLDPNRLIPCNKVLITSTTVLNNSIDEILKYCSRAEKISVIGPTGGFFPDPLFNRGVDVLGGTFVHDSDLFMKLISQNQKWGPSTKKYCVQKANYSGIDFFLEKL